MGKDISHLIKYASTLENLARHNCSDTFPNKNHEHASIVLSKILKYSKKDFILFDDDLKGDIVKHDEVVSFKDSLISFVTRGGNLKIAISDRNPDDDVKLTSLLKKIQELYPKRVSIKLATSEFKNAMKEIYNEKINFAIGDKNKFRLELFGNTSVDNKTREAKGSFNNEKVVDELLKVFNNHYAECEEDYFQCSN